MGLIKILFQEAVTYNLKLLKSDYRKALFSRPCIYGVFSGRLGGMYPIKKKCVGCMRCVLEYPDTCRVDVNPKFLEFMDGYWISDQLNNPLSSPLNTIWYEAETGKIMVRGMGYKGQFGQFGWDLMYTDMSEIVRPTRDGVYGREYISTQVDLQRRSGIVNPSKPKNSILSIPLPIIYDYLPANMLSNSITQSIRGAINKIGTFAIDTVEGSPKNTILLLTDNNYEEYISVMENFRIIEYEGENPAKIISQMKEHTVIFYRMKLSEESLAKSEEIVNLGFDGIHLIADYHGFDFSKQSKFVQPRLHKIHKNLVAKGLRDKIIIIVSGGVNQAEHVPKAIMSGADAVAIDIVSLIALQVQIQGNSRFSNNITIGMDSFDIEWGIQRLINLTTSWYNQLIEIMSAMGIKDVRRLRGEMGRAILDNEIREVAFDGIEQID